MNFAFRSFVGVGLMVAMMMLAGEKNSSLPLSGAPAAKAPGQNVGGRWLWGNASASRYANRSRVLNLVPVALKPGFKPIPNTFAGQDSKPLLSYDWRAGEVRSTTTNVRVEIGNETRTTAATIAHEVLPQSSSVNAASKEQELEGTGTGFVIHPDGLIVTCAHVIEGATSVIARMDGKDVVAKVVARDDLKDLAILRINKTDLPYIVLADSDRVQLAQDIRAIGFPLATTTDRSLKVTRGAISGIVTENDEKTLQVDAAINPGNSGGPIVDDRGQVVGVAKSVLTGRGISNVGFGTPANDVRDLLRRCNADVLPPLDNAGGPDLPGPDLVKKVAPAIVLLEARVDEAARQAKIKNLKFTAAILNEVTTKDPSSGQKKTSPVLGPNFEFGKIAIDDKGEVSDFSGELELPFFSGIAGLAGIEPLPGSGERTWRSVRITSLTINQDAPGDPRGIGRGMPSPKSSRHGSRGKTSPPADKKVLVIPALEIATYTIKSESADKLIIEKKYAIAIIGDDSKEKRFIVSGQGTLTFDRKKRFYSDAEMVLNIELKSGNVTLTMPVNISSQTKHIDKSEIPTGPPKPNVVASTTPQPSSPKPTPSPAPNAASSTARQDASFAGVWRQEVEEGGLSQTWTVTNVQGTWSVHSVYWRSGQEVGSYNGTNIVLKNGKLEFDAAFIKKPIATWLDSMHITVSFVGEKIDVAWRNQRGSGSAKYIRTGHPPAEGTPSRAPVATSSPPTAVNGSAIPTAQFCGTWRREKDKLGFTEFWTITHDQGKWSVDCIIKQGKKEMGACHGTNVVCSNGKLEFTQTYTKKPSDAVSDNTLMTLTEKDENLEVAWRNKDENGTSGLLRIGPPRAATPIPLAANAAPKTRIWSDTSGQFKIDAEVVNVTDDQITLRRTDGREVTIPIAKLSPGDQQYIKDNLRK